MELVLSVPPAAYRGAAKGKQLKQSFTRTNFKHYLYKFQLIS
jgi:hypothetical protein